MIPEASKRLGAWSIPREKIKRLLQLGVDLQTSDDQEADSISLTYVFRHWPWHDRTIAEMLDAMLSGAIRPVGRCTGKEGIAGFLFRKSDLENWFRCTHPVKATSSSIPEAAQFLDIKQEVAYCLVRRGLLPICKEKVGRR